ncbi:MAG: hypothetical protein ACKO2Z_05165, partial [Sphaerospermopsis kisseleviana]
MNNFDIVVAIRHSNGTIDSRYVQPLKQFWYEDPSIDIIRTLEGEKLLDLLTNDLGIVTVDNEKLKLQYLKPGERKEVNVNTESMKLLGRLAEALIVRQCNKDIRKNRVWASYARRGKEVASLDNYIAIGTGLNSTKNNKFYHTKYSPSDTQRDIIWVKKDDPMKELQMGTIRNQGYKVGLQVKVSKDGANVVKSLVNRELNDMKYEVPIVYFDLKGDFSKVAKKLSEETILFAKKNWVIGSDIIAGRDIDLELHDMLDHFYPLVKQLLEIISRWI